MGDTLLEGRYLDIESHTLISIKAHHNRYARVMPQTLIRAGTRERMLFPEANVPLWVLTGVMISTTRFGQEPPLIHPCTWTNVSGPLSYGLISITKHGTRIALDLPAPK